MNRYWRIAPCLTHLRGNKQDRGAQLIDIFDHEYTSKNEAETRATQLAKSHPGTKYEVYEIVSAYIVDGLRRETPDDIEAVARDRLDPPPKEDDVEEELVEPPEVPF